MIELKKGGSKQTQEERRERRDWRMERLAADFKIQHMQPHVQHKCT